MGCCQAVPKAEAFLKRQQLGNVLLDNPLLTNKLYMDPWPCEANGNTKKQDGSLLSVTDQGGRVLVQISTAGKSERVGKSVTEVLDDAGGLVAVLKTESKHDLTPLDGWNKTWHHIYSVKPSVEGQLPASEHKGTPIFSWARVCRKPFTFNCDIYLYDANLPGGYSVKSARSFGLDAYAGFPPRQFSIESVSGGAALFTKTQDKRVEIATAPNTDVALMICTTICVLKLDDEIPSGNAGGGGGGP